MWPLMADEHGIMVTTSDRQGRPVGPAYWVPDDESDDVLSFARAALGRPSPRAWVWTMATAPSRVSLLGRFPDLSGKRRRR
ncbi:hypothetical protein NQ036_03470 [Brevibacterium sp. 91QC2O2]|nr:hypothetical protein [Brevibacterium sp. 91QC2O2]